MNIKSRMIAVLLVAGAACGGCAQYDTVGYRPYATGGTTYVAKPAYYTNAAYVESPLFVGGYTTLMDEPPPPRYDRYGRYDRGRRPGDGRPPAGRFDDRRPNSRQPPPSARTEVARRQVENQVRTAEQQKAVQRQVVQQATAQRQAAAAAAQRQAAAAASAKQQAAAAAARAQSRAVQSTRSRTPRR